MDKGKAPMPSSPPSRDRSRSPMPRRSLPPLSLGAGPSAPPVTRTTIECPFCPASFPVMETDDIKDHMRCHHYSMWQRQILNPGIPQTDVARFIGIASEGSGETEPVREAETSVQTVPVVPDLTVVVKKEDEKEDEKEKK